MAGASFRGYRVEPELNMGEPWERHFGIVSYAKALCGLPKLLCQPAESIDFRERIV
jgi:hypothetical protein